VSEVIYLYGFVPAGSPAPPESVRGLEHGAVELVEAGGFLAAVGRLPAGEYTEETVQARLREVPWVADRAVAHERVVAWFVDHSEIVPARLLTLYSSEAALREAASADGDRVASLLERFRGQREWDLKVSYRPAELTRHLGEISAEVAELDGQIAAAAPGRRFLLARKREDVVRTELTRAARDAAAGLLEALRPHALDTLRLPAPGGEAELPVALNAALLVRTGDAPALRSAAAERTPSLEAHGFAVVLSGPWAPYRFMARAHDG
jgi:hypothetical protein